MIHLEKELIDSVIENYGPDINKINLSNNGLQNISNIHRFGDKLMVLDLSKNDLFDISPLASLPGLTDLLLADNNIENLEVLRHLPNLQNVDISGNNIKTFSALSAIKSLKNLQSLKLQGNTVCSLPGFPRDVFILQPNLLYIDEWERSNFIIPTSDTSMTTLNKKGTISDKISGKVYFLETQLKTMEESFSLLEGLISDNEKNGFHSVLRGKEEDKIPFHRVLKTWRDKMLQSIVLKKINEKKLHENIEMGKKERLKFQRFLKEEEAKSLIWKQRCTSLEQKNVFIESLSNEKEIELEKNKDNIEKMEKKLFYMENQFNNVVSFLNVYKQEIDKKTVTSRIEIIKNVEKLDDYEKRLNSAAERLKFLSAVLAQKNVKLQNSMAAVECQRRLFEAQVQKRKSQIRENQDDFDFFDNFQGENKLSLKNYLSAEGESLLRGLFRQLDNEDNGQVSVTLILFCLLKQNQQPTIQDYRNFLKIIQKIEYLLTNGEKGLNGLNFDDTLTLDRFSMNMSKLENETKGELEKTIGVLRGFCTPLSLLICRGLAFRSFLHLLKGLVSLLLTSESDVEVEVEDVFITWGEFLLQLVPSTQGFSEVEEKGFNRKLTEDEKVLFKSAGFLGDIEWGSLSLVIPTDLSFDQLNELEKKDSEKRETSKKSMAAEIKRLKKERSFLMKQVQTMERTLERRAESIKVFYENDIERMKIREDKWKNEIKSLENNLTMKEADCLKTSELVKKISEENKNLIQTYTKDKESLQEKLKFQETTEFRKFEELINEEKMKFKKLESEYCLIQRETARKEVSFRSLQRDLLRLQTKTNLQEVELNDWKTKYSDVLKEKNENISKHQLSLNEKELKWEEEKNKLTQTIQTLKNSISQLKQPVETNSVGTNTEETLKPTSTPENSLLQESTMQLPKNEKLDFLLPPREVNENQEKVKNQENGINTIESESKEGFNEFPSFSGQQGLLYMKLNKLFKLAEKAVDSDL